MRTVLASLVALVICSLVACSSGGSGGDGGAGHEGGGGGAGSGGAGTGGGGTGGAGTGGAGTGGAGTGGAGTGGAGSGGAGTGGNCTACIACVQAHCGSQVTQCQADTNCKAIRECAMGCTMHLNDCIQAHTAGVLTWGPGVAACANQNCVSNGCPY